MLYSIQKDLSWPHLHSLLLLFGGSKAYLERLDMPVSGATH